MIPAKRRFSDSNVAYGVSNNASVSQDVQLARREAPYMLAIPADMLENMLWALEGEQERSYAAKRRRTRQAYLDSLVAEMDTQINKYEEELHFWQNVSCRIEDRSIRHRCNDLYWHHARLINVIDHVRNRNESEEGKMQDLHWEQNKINGGMAKALLDIFQTSGLMQADPLSHKEPDPGPDPFEPGLLDGVRWGRTAYMDNKAINGSRDIDDSICTPPPQHETPLLWPEKSWHSGEDVATRQARLLEEACGPLDRTLTPATSSHYDEYSFVSFVDSVPPPSPTDVQRILLFDRASIQPWLDAVEPGIAEPSTPEIFSWPCEEIKYGEDCGGAWEQRFLLASGKYREVIDDWAEQCHQNAPVEYEEAMNSIEQCRQNASCEHTKAGAQPRNLTENAESSIPYLHRTFWVQVIRRLLKRFLGGGPIEPF